jgi:uncharacterized protein YndB with AHSA1/START domain
MMPAHDGKELTSTVVVPLTIDRAFALFTDLDRWWPIEYTRAKVVDQEIVIEPHAGGFCYERGANGFRYDWGRVLVYDPPRRLVLAWQTTTPHESGADAETSSTVEVRLVPDGAQRTRVTLEHRDLDRHGSVAAEYRALMASDLGWPLIFGRYAAAAALEGERVAG